MRSLQVRRLPDDVYEALSLRAERAGRSLSQQAIFELRKVPELEARSRRMSTIQELREEIRREGLQSLNIAPEDLIREDRER